MQTFLPFPSFTASAQVLDSKRLGKQRVETLQILKALSDSSYGWQNHPAVKMWRGHEAGLVEYGLAICDEWKGRGYRDTCREKIEEFFKLYPTCPIPSWLGSPSFHASHRSNLLRKEPSHYSQFQWREGPDLPYVWPVA